MARNDHDKSFGRDDRSMEEKLASLDALSNELPPESPAPETTEVLPPNPWMRQDPAPDFGMHQPPQFPSGGYGTPQGNGVQESPYGHSTEAPPLEPLPGAPGAVEQPDPLQTQTLNQSGYGQGSPPPQQPPPQQPPPQQPQYEYQQPYQQQQYGQQSYQQPPGQYGQPQQHQGTGQAPALAPLPVTDEPPMRPSYEPTENLSRETLLRGKRQAPATGWRRVVYKASVGMIRPGESPAELRRRELVARACTPVADGHHRVAVMSLKGGVGKTTTTTGLGAMLASLRGDRVIAVDANPDRGTLSDKVRLETAATVRDLLNERVQIQRYADVRAFTSQSSSRLEVLASDRDPAVSEAFSAEDYHSVANVLEHFYSICITDCGTGLLHSAMSGVLGLADQIVLVSSPSVDGARSASATLDWLEAHHYGDLVRNAVVVLSAVRPRSKSTIDLDRLEHHFATRCRAVVRIPYDPHLEEGAEVELDQLDADTQDAYLVLSATVGDGFAWPRG